MIDQATDLYCIFGNPVGHSKSPTIHNACFKQHHMNAVYLAFEIDNIIDGVSAIRTLNIKGASVTIPFKAHIMEHLDWIDKDAMEIGAVNTVVNRDGRLSGYNTDYQAAIEPLKPFGIDGKAVCIIGAGGAAQAVAYGISKEKGNMIIVNRSTARGEALASKFDSDFIPLHELHGRHDIQADIIINTTSIGMTPHVNESAFPEVLLNPEMIVMDVVYNPLKTKLLAESEKKGCRTIDGLSMFLHQGAAQFKLWTGIRPDIELMRHAINNGEN